MWQIIYDRKNSVLALNMKLRFEIPLREKVPINIS